MFTAALALPLPKHLLEGAYADDKARLMEHGYWTDDFIGTGPFKLRTWAGGSHVVVEAFDGYVLGRPKIDQIEVKAIGDVSRAKLYYLRDKVGKKARVREKLSPHRTASARAKAAAPPAAAEEPAAEPVAVADE